MIRILLALVLLPLAVDAQTVTIASEARCPNDYVALAEVAILEGATPRQADRFGRIYLGPVPGVYDIAYIRDRMGRYGFEIEDVSFAGAGAVRVLLGPASEAQATAASTHQQAPHQTPPPDRTSHQDELARRHVERAVLGHTRQWIGSRVDDVAVDIEEVEWFAENPPADLSTCSVLRVEAYSRGRSRFFLQARTESGRSLDLMATARVRYFTRRLVASHNLDRDQILSRIDLTVESVATSDPATGHIPRAEDLVGQRLKQRIRSGEPVGLEDVESVPVIERGEKVRMIYRGSGFVIESFGKAEHDAGMGEWVLVDNLRSRREVRARAIGPATVEITPNQMGAFGK